MLTVGLVGYLMLLVGCAFFVVFFVAAGVLLFRLSLCVVVGWRLLVCLFCVVVCLCLFLLEVDRAIAFVGSLLLVGGLLNVLCCRVIVFVLFQVSWLLVAGCWLVVVRY